MSQPQGRVIVVGSSNTDLVVPCRKLPRPGETVLGGDLLTFAGGKGANQAVGAARAGAKVSFIGAFGDDAFGRARRADLEKEGIDCSGSVTKKNVPSGVALIGIGAGSGPTRAENLIIVAPGANAHLRPKDVKKALAGKLAPADVVLCSLEVPLDSVLCALHSALEAGATSILNPAPLPRHPLLKKLAAAATVLTPNKTEFGQLLKVISKRGVLAFLSNPRPAWLAVTQGAKGVDYYCGGDAKAVRIPAPKVKPVDTVGAGDCFNGCLAAQLARNPRDRQGALRFAIAAAALKVTRQGAQAGMPRRAEIMRINRS